MNGKKELVTVTVRLSRSAVEIAKRLAEARGETISEVVENVLQAADHQ